MQPFSASARKRTKQSRIEFPAAYLPPGVAKAVCHRDYGQANDIQVKILDDRIVIANPGQLPFDLTLEDLEDPGLVVASSKQADCPGVL